MSQYHRIPANTSFKASSAYGFVSPVAAVLLDITRSYCAVTTKCSVTRQRVHISKFHRSKQNFRLLGDHISKPSGCPDTSCFLLLLTASDALIEIYKFREHLVVIVRYYLTQSPKHKCISNTRLENSYSVILFISAHLNGLEECANFCWRCISISFLVSKINV